MGDIIDLDPSDVIDLNALAPKPVVVHIGDRDIAIPPPKLSEVLRIGTLGEHLKDASSLSDERLEKVATDLTEQIYKCIPDLNGQALATGQLLKLVEILSEMSIPPDSIALKKQNITVDTPKAPQN